MNWPDDVVSKVARVLCKVGMNVGCVPESQAALSAITLQDIAKLPEVKAVVEAAEKTLRMVFIDGLLLQDLQDALAPFTEASNG